MCVCTNIIKYLARRKKGNPATCDNMASPMEHYPRCNKSNKDKHSMRLLICGISKSYIHGKSKMVAARGWEMAKIRDAGQRV